MGWIKIVGKGLEYTGKFAQADGFDEWAAEQGKAVVESIATKQAFSFLGKQRKAKNLLWNGLMTAARSETLAASLKDEAVSYQNVVGELAESVESNEYISQGKAFVIPRFLVTAVAFDAIAKRLSSSQELVRLEGGETLRSYFLSQFATQLDSTFITMPFSSIKPIPTANNWVIVGYDPNYDWKDKLSGHYYVVQTQGKEMSKTDAKSLDLLLNKLKILLGRFTVEDVNSRSQAWHTWLNSRSSKLLEVSVPQA